MSTKGKLIIAALICSIISGLFVAENMTAQQVDMFFFWQSFSGAFIASMAQYGNKRYWDLQMCRILGSYVFINIVDEFFKRNEIFNLPEYFIGFLFVWYYVHKAAKDGQAEWYRKIFKVKLYDQNTDVRH